MILSCIDLKQEGIKDKLILTLSLHEFSWKHYYENYNNALTYISAKGLEGNYIINRQSMAYLFIMRHTFELLLKYSLEQQGITPPPSHNLSTIYSKFQFGIPSELMQAINIIDKDIDGSCYKYINNKAGNPYWDFEKLEVFDVLKFCNLSIFPGLMLNGIGPEINWESKKHKWDFTCHMNEVRTLGQLRTCYDFSIGLLLEGVANDEININNIYLPLLFLVRHSLEIALKFNLDRLQITTTTQTQRLIASYHSLESLYNNYMSYLQIFESQLTTGVVGEYVNLKTNYERLNKIIHNLDTNSQAFRYPTNNNGAAINLNLKPDVIYEVIELYYFTDSFITFTIEVFRENGIKI